MFKWLLSFLLVLVVVDASRYSDPLLYSLKGARQQLVNDKEFLRSYNMNNLNTLASLSRYGNLIHNRRFSGPDI